MRLLYVAKRSALTRFLALTKTGPGCWYWKGRHDKEGYPEFKVDQQKRKTHRWACGFVWGLRPGQHVHHLCERKQCVNPWHLEPVSRLEHAARHRRRR